MDQYLKFLDALDKYFQTPDWKSLFLTGGCFWFASTLQKQIPYSDIMLNRGQEHCALRFFAGLYDVSGKISKKNFRPAAEKDLLYMKKNYIPSFNVPKLEQYLQSIELL